MAVLMPGRSAARADPCPAPGVPVARAYASGYLAALAGPATVPTLLVGDSIAERWPQASIARWMNGPVQNLGVSGDTPQNLLWRLQQVQGGRTWTRILLIVGINGAYLDATCHGVAESVLADIRLLHRIAPRAEIVALGVMPIGKGLPGPAKQVEAINARLAARTTVDRFTLVDPTRDLVAACGGRETCDRLVPDWVHPTPLGYEHIGPMVAAAFGSHPAR